MRGRYAWALALPLACCAVQPLPPVSDAGPPMLAPLPAVALPEPAAAGLVLDAPQAVLVLVPRTEPLRNGVTARKIMPLTPATLAPAKLGTPIQY